MEAELLRENLLPPCQTACPIKMDVQGYLSSIAREDFENSFRVIRETNPLPSVCGRVCHHSCEDRCRRGQVDEPLSIRKLKRFPLDSLAKFGVLSQAEKDFLQFKARREKQNQRVAVVGSGPAGLTCAHDLALFGYEVTIFEVLPVLGGMLRVGIPEYRLPKKILQGDIDFILNLGIKVETEKKVGQEITLEGLKRSFQAIFLAIGAHHNLKLGIAGEELKDVIAGTLFLKKVALGEKIEVGEKVVVVGGGNTAIDAARTALRLGAKEVLVVYRRSQEEMPAYPWDQQEAKEEGVKFQFLAVPLAIEEGGGKALSLKCVKTKLTEVDKDGRKRPIPVPGSEFEITADTVISAVGQAPETSFLNKEKAMRISKTGKIRTDEDSLSTSRDGIFAGGDAVTGPKTVVEAMAAGRKVALSIKNYLEKGQLAGLKKRRIEAIGDIPSKTKEVIKKFPRLEGSFLEEKIRRRNFEEVELGYLEPEGVRESQRCLNCGAGAFVLKERCIACLTCVRICPFGAPFIFDEKAQISDEACQACGICIYACPEEAIILKSGEEERIEKELESIFAKRTQEVVFPTFLCVYGLYPVRRTGPSNGIYGNTDTEVKMTFPEEVNPAFGGVKVIKVLCTAKVSQKHLLKAFELGATGVFVVSCKEQALNCSGSGQAPNQNGSGQACHFLEGSFWVGKRGRYVRGILNDLGLGKERLKLFNLEPPFASELSEVFQKSVQEIKKTTSPLVDKYSK